MTQHDRFGRLNIRQMENGSYGFELFKVRVEVWPVGADQAGLWLISSDDAWRSMPLSADKEPHQSVEDILAGEGATEITLMHSTSWRIDEASVMLTYMAVVNCHDSVRDEWPEARPISVELMDVVGKPLPTEPTTQPLPRYVDVLHHGLRHLRFLLDTDAAARAALTSTWRRHLAQLEPALSGMYT